MGTESERHEIAAKLGSIPAKCVARVVVAEGYVQSLIDALQASLVQAKQKTDKANGQDRSHDKTA